MSARIAAVDLGKSAAKLVVAELEGDALRVVSRETTAHDGRPLDVFADWYRRQRVADGRGLGVTGIHADGIIEPALSCLPEDACLEAALAARRDLVGALNLVSVGARGYSVLSRDARGRVQHLENDKCSSGTGETIVKTAARFGMRLEEADRIAAAASGAIAITARCSVFAKSEMTHFGNQGLPVDQLFRGYFDAIARYVAALLGRIRTPGPVYLIGGGSRLETLRRCLSEHTGGTVLVPEDALLFEALGALHIAAEQNTATLPAGPETLMRSTRRRFEILKPAREHAGRVTLQPALPVARGAAEAPAVLGLDLGSTGSKAALVSIASGEIVLDVYDRTRGNPVEATERLIRRLLEAVKPDVRAIGVTGSGREAAATVLRAAFPDLSDHIVVQNEIVAHATAAVRSDPDHGKSLSVVEIGGQDAKFIQISGGRIVESDMNKACSAGTGSFLEEQAVFYGVDDIRDFARQAEQATRPPDLGQMCTVFVADAAAEARREGFAVEDLFAGFQYSVIHNYLDRVMGQRTFGERVFFQGKPASSPSLAWTLAAVSGREVVVPPNPGAMGAWGIGLSALSALETFETRFPLEAALDARVVERADFRCRDSRCATLCNIDRTTVRVGDERHTVLSGGACPKFEVATATRPKLPLDAPSAFDERERLLERFTPRARPGAPRVAVPLAGSLAGFLPWVTTFLSELGMDVVIQRSSPRALSRGEELCYAYDSCAPAKIAHAAVDVDAPVLFFPKLLGLTDRDGGCGATCSTEQAMPDMIAGVVRDQRRDLRVVAPAIPLGDGPTSPGVILALAASARVLGADPSRVVGAAFRAAEAQADYERELAEIGRRTLQYGLPVVVVCGSLHVIHDPAVNAGIPAILRQNGVLALPMDSYPVPGHVDALPRIPWADARRALRVALAVRERGNAFPLLLSSFGCGPASFVEQVFSLLMRDYPHTVLESDGHGGAAGYVTRVQSFLHGVRQHGSAPASAPHRQLRLLDPIETRPLSKEKDARLVLLSVGKRLAPLAAAAYRSLGYDAVAAPPGSPEVLARGRRDCSGKECLPYQVMWGAFKKHLEESNDDKRTVLIQVSGQGACRNCMFSIKDRMSLERMGLGDRVTVRHFGGEREARNAFLSRFWSATVAWDIFAQLAAYHRPIVRDGQALDALDDALNESLLRTAERPGRRLAEITALVERAARQYAAMPRIHDERELRTVLLTGDIYVRTDEFANDDLVRSLNDRKLRVVIDPVWVLVEYLSEVHSAELLGLPTGLVEGTLSRAVMRRVRKRLYSRARAHHAWLPAPDVPDLLDLARPFIDRYPLGEAPITIGSVMHAWQRRSCDGVVIASPWGCGPSLVSESLLRHERDIPMLFLYSDGSPGDDRRLNGFAHRLRRAAPRAEVS